jgi:predicted HTH transcriptional regulator
VNIKKLIFEGEGVTLDFKKTIANCEKIAKTLVAFANNKGGRLLVGVTDDGSIHGLKAEEEEKYMLAKAANFYCKPAVEIHFEEVYIEEKVVLVAEIKESDSKPNYALGEDKKWWVYIRVKDKTLLASRIVMDVLRRRNSEENILIEYSSKEKTLLEYLENHKRITSQEYSKISNLSRRKAQTILVNLVLSGIIQLHTTEKEEYYTTSKVFKNSVM